jgi:Protein of unknown function (DUF3224)
MFRTVLTRSLLVPLAIVLAATESMAAHASTPMPATGTFQYTDSTFHDVRSAGGNTIIEDNVAHVTYSGTFTGTSTVEGLLIFHPNGTATAEDIETFTGTVNGVPGTVTLRLTGGGPGLAFSATDVVLSATGALAGLHGVLDLTGLVTIPQGPTGTYTGQIQYGAS